MNLHQSNSQQPLLITTAVEAERKAVLEGVRSTDRVDVISVGVGPIAAAANTSAVLAKKQYRQVINMGIGGGFTPQVRLESLVVSTEIVAVELGAETEEGFTFMDKLGLGDVRFSCDSLLVDEIVTKLKRSHAPVIAGPILTVSTVTGTSTTAQERKRRVPHAVAEGMEGFGVATAAQTHQVPMIEVRAISNPVGPRDRSAWRMKEALQLLTEASQKLMEEYRS